tara:strand:+ start:1223 stop:3826 length:2604 start_codon:yes stop_codon:yes gene_type:complete
MAGIGDAAPRKYVIEELIRRTIGMHGNKGATSSEVSGIEDLKNWHNTKRPWIRMVSNAVPYDMAKTLPEYKLAQEVYGGDPDPETRFRHILWGGKGQYDASLKQVRLAHEINDIYKNPFQLPEADNTNPSYRPMPGITAVDVNYAGTMGALKKATISFKCYTLDDLERLEKLYLYPGIRVLVEWGWSVNTADEDADRKSVRINPMELDTETMKNPVNIYNHIQRTRMESGGCYDGLFGTITNFGWTVNKDLSFDCTTKIVDYGDSIFTIPVNTPFKSGGKDQTKKDGLTLISALKTIKKQFAKSGVGKDNKITEETVTLDQLGSYKAKIFKKLSGTTSKSVGDKNKTEREKQLYIRFGDIVDKLCNRLYALTSDSTRIDDKTSVAQAIAMFSIGGTATDQDVGLSVADIETVNDQGDADKEILIPRQPISVISNHKALISTDPDICLLPNQIGEQPYSVVDEAKATWGTSKYVPTGLKGEGCDFNVPTKQAGALGHKDYAREAENGAGFLANIFVNFEILIIHAETAGNVHDFLNSICMDINRACGNVWMFQWRMLDEYPGFMTCIDQNFSWSSKIEALELSVDSQSSIVKSLAMQSQISSNHQNALYMAANAPDTGEQVKIGEMQNKNIIPLQVEFELDGVSGIQYGTSFSINYLPQRYREQTYLFAKGVQHSISADSWTTTVTTIFRWAPLAAALRKIQLNKVVNHLKDSTSAIRDSITIDNPEDTTTVIERQYGNEKFFPVGIFRSAESENLTMGGDSDNAVAGMTLDKVEETQETAEEQTENLSVGLARTYHLGSNDGDVRENATILVDIINKLPAPAAAGTDAASAGTYKAPENERVILNPDRKVYEVTDTEYSTNTDVAIG